VARIVKKYHPLSKPVVGGLSASYYWRELFQYPEIDYVLRGYSTEEEKYNRTPFLTFLPTLVRS
jgi:hypothetical protein